MKIARNVCVKCSLFILLALLTSGGALLHGTSFAADETFTPTAVIKVPNAGFLPAVCGATATNPFCLTSFDIGFVDPQLGLYFLADRTNKTVDKVVTSTNAISQLAAGSFVGVQTGTDTSGPNGVITANNHKKSGQPMAFCVVTPPKITRVPPPRPPQHKPAAYRSLTLKRAK